MCGIVGAVGHQQCSEMLIDSLKRLEYRGYDSSGIVTIHNNAIARRRAVGKLVNLDQDLRAAPLGGGYRHWPYALGNTWRSHNRKCSSACGGRPCGDCP